MTALALLPHRLQNNPFPASVIICLYQISSLILTTFMRIQGDVTFFFFYYLKTTLFIKCTNKLQHAT